MYICMYRKNVYVTLTNIIVSKNVKAFVKASLYYTNVLIIYWIENIFLQVYYFKQPNITEIVKACIFIRIRQVGLV